MTISEMRTATIGSVSTGTLRSADLLESFRNELEWQLQRQERTPENRDQIDRLHDVHGSLSDEFYDDDGNIIESERLDMAIWEELVPALEEFTPPYCYFGAHTGDCADFGYWPCWDQIDELQKFDDLADVPDDIDDDFCIVNDHGNVSIYTADGSLIWDCV